MGNYFFLPLFIRLLVCLNVVDRFMEILNDTILLR